MTEENNGHEAHGDPELMSLTAGAKKIDAELTALQPITNGSLIGSAERQRYSQLRDESKAAWQRVKNRVVTLMSLTSDLW